MKKKIQIVLFLAVFLILAGFTKIKHEEKKMKNNIVLFQKLHIEKSSELERSEYEKFSIGGINR